MSADQTKTFIALLVGALSMGGFVGAMIVITVKEGLAIESRPVCDGQRGHIVRSVDGLICVKGERL